MPILAVGTRYGSRAGMVQMTRYLLVTDATASEVEQKAGLHGHDTPFGVLVEKPRPFSLESELEKLDCDLYPNKPRCTCGRFAVLHSPRCPFAYGVS